jgi:hypothetical protein
LLGIGKLPQIRQSDQIYAQKITKSIKGKNVTRTASDDEPAYLIEQEDGDKVLKS